MDFAKLSSNEKLAVYGAVAAIVGSFISLSTGTGSFGLLSGILMLVIVFLPQFSPTTKLPGSKGSLMLVVGGAGSLFALLALLAWLPYLGLFGGVFIGLLISIAGGLLMGWASWKEFQAEGGKFNLGMASSAPPAPPAPPAAPPPPPAAPMSPPAEPMSGSMGETTSGSMGETTSGSMGETTSGSMGETTSGSMGETTSGSMGETTSGSMGEPMGSERTEDDPQA